MKHMRRQPRLPPLPLLEFRLWRKRMRELVLLDFGDPRRDLERVDAFVGEQFPHLLVPLGFGGRSSCFRLRIETLESSGRLES